MIFLDSFSGSAVDLKPDQRTAENVLAALGKDPRISTFDMSEYPWLYRIIRDLINSGKITEDKSEQYPWHRFVVVENQEAA